MVTINTTIWLACRYGLKRFVFNWIKKKSYYNSMGELCRRNIDVRNKSNKTPFWKACRYGQKEIARMLLNSGADINHTDDRGRTPIYMAVKHDHEDTVKYVLKHEPDLNIQDTAGETALFQSVKKYFTDTTRMLLEACIDLNIQNNNGETSLYMAAKYNHFETFELLLDNGADPNIVTDEDKSILFFLFNNHYMYEFRKFIKLETVDLNMTNKDGKTILYELCDDLPDNLNEEQRSDLILELIHLGADVSIKSNEGITPFEAALKNHQFNVVGLFYVNNISHTIPERKRDMLLLKSTRIDVVEYSELFLFLCKDVNVSNSRRRTALYYATIRNDIELVAMLLSRGANPHLTDMEENTPYEIAKRRNFKEIINLFDAFPLSLSYTTHMRSHLELKFKNLLKE